MRLTKTSLTDAYVVELDKHSDNRGWFARTYCEQEFIDNGLEPCSSQCNAAFNELRGTLRGLHFQIAPHEEAKLVRCVSGAIYDVIVDLRADSATVGEWAGFELSSTNGSALYIPAGFAHGFITLQDSTEVFYQMSTPYVADSARGIHYLSSALGIDWPFTPSVVSERDRDLSAYDPKQHITHTKMADQ